MAETARDTRPLEIALDAAIAHVRSFTTQTELTDEDEFV
jgi:hypothetical protein